VVQRKLTSRVAQRKRSKGPSSRGKPPVTSVQGLLNGGGEVVLYETPDGGVQLDVRLERETVWLTQAQMADLFARERSVITKHLRNVFREGELSQKSNVQNLHIASSDKPVAYYNLDVIISVGYRVKSHRGTQFRIWATRTLKDHLLRGYTLNEKRLREKGLGEIEQAVGLLTRTLTQHALVTDEGRAVLEVVQQYARAWRLLLEYDEGRLPEKPGHPVTPAAGLSPEDATTIIARLRETLAARGEASDLFGAQRSDQLSGILGAVEQTFDGVPLYPTVQGRAAHLLYFVIKDHPFADGNKRIGTLLFLEYLRRNRLLARPDGSPRFADNAMVALALLVAESEPAQKDLMIRLILNLLEDGST
jgi:prophage maintenance system killer protein